MNYKIYRHSRELLTTGCIKIYPGKYADQHWSESNVYIEEDTFGLAAGILERHFSEYDHYGEADMPVSIGRKVVDDWRKAAGLLLSCDSKNIFDILSLGSLSYRFSIDEVYTDKSKISDMLFELADICEDLFVKEEWISFVGI